MNSQKAHEKILNITNHKGNANLNYNKILLHTHYYGYYKEQKTENKKYW